MREGQNSCVGIHWQVIFARMIGGSCRLRSPPCTNHFVALTLHSRRMDRIPRFAPPMKGNMKLIVEVNSKLVLVQPGSRGQRTAWQGHGQLVWRDAEPMGPQCNAREVVVSAGTYSLVRIKNPFRASGEPWLVIKGSMVGAAESHWRRLLAGTRGARLERIEEGETPQPHGVHFTEKLKAA
jgi:hypothetical protein